MKNYNKILEAVNRGIQLALDDFDDDQVQNIRSKQVQNRDYTKEYLDLMKEVVDLGLPSGTLWCKYNFGATCEPNNDKSWFGDYYAWGELEANKKLFDWDHYKFYNGPDTKANKGHHLVIEYYISKYGMDDKLEMLQPEDDAAYQFKKCHNFKFHIPTAEQAQELINNTKVIYVKDASKDPKYESVKGYTGAGWFFFSKINGNYLFFPRTGVRDGRKFSDTDGTGIWLSQVSTGSIASKCNCAQSLKFVQFNGARSEPYLFGFWKHEGVPIRPVVNL